MKGGENEDRHDAVEVEIEDEDEDEDENEDKWEEE